MCADPLEGEPVTLVVTATDDDARETLQAAMADMAVTITDRLQFATLCVETTEDVVADICALEGIESVETDNAVGYGGDAGEDVER